MVSVAQIVFKRLSNEPFLLAAVRRKIVNFGALAVELKPEVEKELGKEVKVSAIAMALHRLSEKPLPLFLNNPLKLKTELTIRTNLVDITVQRSSTLLDRVRDLYALVDFAHGDFLNIVWGMYEVGIITNEQYSSKAAKILSSETVINTETDLVAVFMKLDKAFFYSPGGLNRVTHELAWHNINVFEAISTMTEFTVLVKKKDLTRSFDVLDALFSKTPIEPAEKK